MPQTKTTLNSIAKEHLLHTIITKMDETEPFFASFNELLFIEDCITTISNINKPANPSKDAPLLEQTKTRLKMLMAKENPTLSNILADPSFEKVIESLNTKDRQQAILSGLTEAAKAAKEALQVAYNTFNMKISDQLKLMANDESNTLLTHLKTCGDHLPPKETTEKSLSEILTTIFNEEVTDRILCNGQHSIVNAQKLQKGFMRRVTKKVVNFGKEAEEAAEQAYGTAHFPSKLLNGEITDAAEKINGMTNIIAVVSPPISPTDDDFAAALDRNNKNRLWWIKKLLLLDSMSLNVEVSAEHAEIYQKCSLLQSQFLNLIADDEGTNINNLNQLTQIIIRSKNIAQKFDSSEKSTTKTQLENLDKILEQVETLQVDFLNLTTALQEECKGKEIAIDSPEFKRKLKEKQAEWLSKKAADYLVIALKGNDKDKKYLEKFIKNGIQNDERSPLLDILNPKQQRNLVIALFIFTVVSTNANSIFSVTLALSQAELTSELIISSLGHLGFSTILTGLAMYALYRLMLAPTAQKETAVSTRSHGLFTDNKSTDNQANEANKTLEIVVEA